MKSVQFISYYLLLPLLGLFAQTTAPLPPALLRQLDSIATQDVPPNAPGIATAIVQNGEVVYQKWAGIADFADSSLITADTRFNLASNGKQFTALAVLTLIDAGKLKLTDDLRTFFPLLFPRIKEKISIGHLLTHSSGIRDVYDLWSLQGFTWWKQSFNNNDVLALLSKQEELNFNPGNQYLYSNSNYILLAMLVEKLSGQSFTAYTNNLFRMLGMHATSFEDNYNNIRKPIARAYFNFNTWTTYNWIWNVCGDGNLFSTLNDQLRWEKIVQGKVVTPVSKAIIQKSQQLVEQSVVTNYGYGLEFGNYKGLAYTFHEGATGAWKATVLRFPEKNVTMLTFTNTGKSIPAMQTRQMADVFFALQTEKPSWLTVPATIGSYVDEKELTGIYLTGNDFAFQFELRNGKLYLKRNGRNDVELEREADNVFHQKNDPAFKQAFVKNTKGEMEVTAYYTTHAPYTLVRANSNWNKFSFHSLNGLYINSETNTQLQVQYTADKNYAVVFNGKDSSTALLVTPAKMLLNNYVLYIAKTKAGNPVLLLNGDRIRRVKFVKQRK